MKVFVKLLFGGLTLSAICMIAPTVSCAFADNAPEPLPEHHHMTGMMPIPAMNEATKTSTAQYTLPQIKLTRAADGKVVSLPEELNDGRPVILDFIYTSCTEICPVTSRTFAQLQRKLGSDRDKVHMVSISIDPEQDTPAVLNKYAKKYGAGPEWQHYTGAMEASIATQKAFDVYRGDKMNHTPVTFLRAAPGRLWVRIDGFASADELLHKYRELVASR
jgi:protein SCO1/2